MSLSIILTVIIILLFIKTIINYIDLVYIKRPHCRYQTHWLKNEYFNNKNQVLKYITENQIQYDIYILTSDPACISMGDNNNGPYIHSPDKDKCKCGYKICKEKYTNLLSKFNKTINTY